MMTDNFTKEKARALGGLTLAFFGDSVYEVLVREQIVKKGNLPVDKLHKAAVKMVNAGFQAAAYDYILPLLTEEEAEMAKRGRNATGNHVPRSASAKDYRKATGLEALFGYLYLADLHDRMNELFCIICNMEIGGNQDKKE